MSRFRNKIDIEELRYQNDNDAKSI